jgi:hypothetical protein
MAKQTKAKKLRTMRRLLEINQGLRIIQMKDVEPLALSMKLAKAVSSIKEPLERYDVLLKKINSEFSVEFHPVNGTPMVDDELREKYNTRMDELLAIEEEVEIPNFKFSDFKKLKGVTPSFFIMMGDLIEDDSK